MKSSNQSSILPTPARSSAKPQQSPKSINLKTKTQVLEDRTCDGFEAWAALSRERKQAADLATGIFQIKSLLLIFDLGQLDHEDTLLSKSVIV